MKISEMTTDQACDAVVRLTNPIANITDDPKLEPMLKEIGQYEGRKDLSLLKVISSMLPKAVPLLLKDHKNDLYEIISILSGKKREEIGTMRMTQTIAILRESIDEELIGFFKSSSSPTEKEGEEQP